MRLTAFSTEVEHALPGRRSLFTDLVLRDPGADVPVLLVEVDHENEGVGTLVEKLATYRAELPAKGAAKAAFEASMRRPGARTHALRLWPTVYPPTGREGLPPLALVFEAGRKRTRPGTKPLTPEQKKEKTKADHLRLLRRIQAVEAASEDAWYAPPYRGDNLTARDHHRALPIVATTLPLLRRFGAGPRGTGSAGTAGIPSPMRLTTRTATSCSPSSRLPPTGPARNGSRSGGRWSASGAARRAPAAGRRSRMSGGPSASGPPGATTGCALVAARPPPTSRPGWRPSASEPPPKPRPRRSGAAPGGAAPDPASPGAPLLTCRAGEFRHPS
ncbi:hypothetical protein ACWCXH_39355 [Kitasatospora sp. NPDC001660]